MAVLCRNDLSKIPVSQGKNELTRHKIGLGKVLFVGKAGLGAKEGLQMGLGHMDMMGGRFYHNFHCNILLIL